MRLQYERKNGDLFALCHIGDVTLSIKEHGESDGRTAYEYEIAGPVVDSEDHPYGWGTDLYSGRFSSPTLAEMLGTLLAFVEAAGESYGRTHEDDPDSFPEDVMRWASENRDEIGMARFELEEEIGHTVQARTLAYQWHSGQWTALYAFASSGIVEDKGLLLAEIDKLKNLMFEEEFETIRWVVEDGLTDLGVDNDLFAPWYFEDFQITD
jgi:hypothetical protein